MLLFGANEGKTERCCKNTKIILLALIIGVSIGIVIAVHARELVEFMYPLPGTISTGRYNITVQKDLGPDGWIVSIITPPAYGTRDFEAYKVERVALLKVAAQKNPEKIAWATISFNRLNTSRLEVLKNKYSLKFLGISGSASNNLENDSDASGIGINAELLGDNLGLFSRIHNVDAKATLNNLNWLSKEPDVILVDLNIDGEIHESVHII